MPVRGFLCRAGCCLSALLVALVLRPAGGNTGVWRLRPDLKLNTIFVGLPSPIRLIFVPNSPRVLVVNKNGRIYSYPNITSRSTDYTILLDISTEVHDRSDHGLLDAVLHPQFASGQPYLYLHYTAEPVPSLSDACTFFPAPFYLSACTLHGRITRYRLDAGATVATDRQVLMDKEHCITADSHGVGQLKFDAAGNLYAAFGDGAQYDAVDYGIPLDGCRVPGGPAAQGQYLAQADDNLRGKLIRVNAAAAIKTGGLWVRGTDYRVVAKGLRNPVRMSLNPLDGGLAISNVGWNTRDEVEYFTGADARGSAVVNFGWPCFEGSYANPSNLDWLRQNGSYAVCADLVDRRAPSRLPAFEMSRGVSPVASSPNVCNGYTSAPVGLVWYSGPAGTLKMPDYANRFFFNDYARGCGFMFENTAAGTPDWPNPNLLYTCASVSGSCGVVDQVVGPDGYLYFVDLQGQSIVRIADIDDTNAVDNGNTFAVTSIPGVDFKLTTDQPDRTWSCCSEASFELEITPAVGGSKLVGAPVFSISVSHCFANPCTGGNDCHQHTVSNFFLAEDLDTFRWGGWWSQSPHAMESWVTVSALSNWDGQYVKTELMTHARTYQVTVGVRPALPLRVVLEDTTCWNPPCDVQKMADTAVAAAALPITTALGDVPFGFLEWVAYDSITGQLVTTSTDMAYNGYVDRDLDLIAVYEEIAPTVVVTVPAPRGTSAKADFGFVSVTWEATSLARTGFYTLIRIWSSNGVVARGSAVLSEVGSATVPIPTNLTSQVLINIEAYNYNPVTRQRSIAVLVGSTMTTNTPSSTSSGSCAWAMSAPLQAQALWEESAATPADTLYPGFRPPHKFTESALVRPDKQAWASAYRDFFQQIRRQVALKPSVPSKTAGFVSGLSATGINTAGLTAKALSGLAGL